LQDLLQIGMDCDEEQGIATQIEEIVVQPHLRSVQNALPKIHDGAFEMCAGAILSIWFAWSRYFQLGERLTIYFSARGKWKRVQGNKK